MEQASKSRFYFQSLILFIIIAVTIYSKISSGKHYIKKSYNNILYQKLRYEHFKKKTENVDTMFWHYNYRAYDSMEYFLLRYKLKEEYFTRPVAESALDIYVSYKIANEKLKYNIYSFFLPDSSIMYVKTKHILRHEQTHFDICELYVRKIKYALWHSKLRDTTSVDSLISALKTEHILRQKLYDSLYLDDQENNGYSDKVNDNWAKQINKELQILKKFTSSEQTILYKF